LRKRIVSGDVPDVLKTKRTGGAGFGRLVPVKITAASLKDRLKAVLKRNHAQRKAR